MATSLLADLQNATETIKEKLSESQAPSASEKELLKQFEELAVSSLLEMKLNDLRINCARLMTASACQALPDIAIQPILAVLERIWNESQWIDKFEEMYTERNSLKELFCFQQDLHDHLKDSMERCKLESVKYLVAFGMVSHDFIDIVSSSWAFEVNISN